MLHLFVAAAALLISQSAYAWGPNPYASKTCAEGLAGEFVGEVTENSKAQLFHPAYRSRSGPDSPRNARSLGLAPSSLKPSIVAVPQPRPGPSTATTETEAGTTGASSHPARSAVASPSTWTPRPHPAQVESQELGWDFQRDPISIPLPTDEFVTFIGGEHADRVQSLFVTDAGDIYIAGNTASHDFPTTPGAWQPTHAGTPGQGYASQDGYVAKLTAEGELVWSTFIGGSQREGLYGVRVDDAGYVYVVGTTASADFPVTPNAFDTRYGGVDGEYGGDGYAVKLTPDGANAVYSTFIGGSDQESLRGGLSLDPAGNLWASGNTRSVDFPTTEGAFQLSYIGGTADGYVVKLSPDGSEMLYASYLGGTGHDHAMSGVVPLPDGTFIVAGTTGSDDFPTTENAAQPEFGGGSGGLWGGDGWVIRLSADGSDMVYGTYVGGSGDDMITHNHGVAVDSLFRATITGHTTSADFGGVLGTAFQATLPATRSGYVARVSLDGSLIEATYLSGTDRDVIEINDVYVDRSGQVMVTGHTEASDFPTTRNAYQTDYAGGNGDGFAAILDPTLSSLVYGSYFGGTGIQNLPDRGRSISIHPDGGFVVGGSTNSDDFPILLPAFQEEYAGGERDGWIARLMH